LRALLDEQVPAELSESISEFSPHEVSTVGAMGWKGLKNGLLLLQMREAGFAVLITIDRRMEYQQNIPRSGVGLIVLHAFRARFAELSPLAPQIAGALDRIGPGEIIHLHAQPPN
jgi:hypothetical protein